MTILLQLDLFGNHTRIVKQTKRSKKPRIKKAFTKPIQKKERPLKL